MTDEVHKACRLGDVGRLAGLLQDRAEAANERDSKLGWSPLYCSVVSNQVRSVQYLLKQGADPNLQNRLGEGPLHQAAYNNFLLIAEMLLSHGASPDLAQNDGDTPLHHACLRGHLAMVELLLKYHADPCKSNLLLCKTPIDYALDNNHSSIVQLLHQKKHKSFVAVTEESPLSKYSTIEPESEKTSRSRIGTQSSLFLWLGKIKLEGVYDVLLQNGFDELGSLLETMRGCSPLTLDSLQSMGVGKAGHRMRLLARLEEEAVRKPRMSNSKSLSSITWCVKPPASPGLGIAEGFEEFLNGLGLGKLREKFAAAGIDDFEQAVFLMNSRYPITDDFLSREVGIDKIGYRHRVLSRLNVEAGLKKKSLNIERETVKAACDCIIA
jgi:hypothetical protein